MGFAVLLVDYCTILDTLKFIDKCEMYLRSSENKKYIIIDNSHNAEAYRYLSSHYLKIEDFVFEGREVSIFKYKNASVICDALMKNVGYARGNNLAARLAKKLYPKYNLLISNNDIDFERTYDLDLVDSLFSEEKYAIIAPDVIQKEQHLNPMYFVNDSYHLYTCYINTVLIKKIKPKLNYDKKTFTGCFWFFNREYFDKVDGFDESTFLYYEELIMENKMSEVEGELYYYPDMQVIHNHNFSHKNIKKSLKYICVYHKSGMYYASKYLKKHKVEIVFANTLFYILLPVYCLEHIVLDIRMMGKGLDTE